MQKKRHRQGREWVVNKRNLEGTSCQEKLRKNACHYNFFLNETFFLLSIISYYGTGMIYVRRKKYIQPIKQKKT